MSKRRKFGAFIFSILLFFSLEYFIQHNVKALPQALQLIAFASLPIAGGLITLSFCSMLGSFADIKNSVASYLFELVAEDSARNFFIGFLVIGYLNLVRPSLAFNMLFLPYLEWAVIALTVYAMYTMTRPAANQLYVSSVSLSWKRHVQVIRAETGRDLMYTTSVLEQFVNHGVKEPLLIYLTLHLQRLGKTDEEILRTLSPLIDYREYAQRHKLYYLAFPWAKRKVALRNRKAREDLLNALLEKMGGLRSE